jgi:5-methylcytosine-specific restriction endonuclease McrA
LNPPLTISQNESFIMGNTKLSKEKRYLNRTIMAKLKSLGIDYVSMEHATHAVARALSIDVEHLTSLAARIAVVHRLNGEDPATAYMQAKRLLKENQAERRARKEHKRAEMPIYLPGIPSASQTDDDIRKFYDSWEWKRLSYDTKVRRGRRCECCGARAPDVKIITDHIKPLRHYWHLRLDPMNLQILCDDCNMGKGSRDKTDFRPQLAAPPPRRTSWAFARMDARTYAPIGGDDIDERELPEAAIEAIRSARSGDY